MGPYDNWQCSKGGCDSNGNGRAVSLPHVVGSDGCAQMIHRGVSSGLIHGRWADRDCAEERPYACAQVAPSPPPPSPTRPPAAAVASGEHALRALYESAGGTLWRTNRNWMTGDPCEDQWHGVSCDPSIGGLVVTDVVLSQNQLRGTLPAQLGELTRLRTLELDDSTLLSGTLPASFGRIQQLRHAPPSVARPACVKRVSNQI